MAGLIWVGAGRPTICGLRSSFQPLSKARPTARRRFRFCKCFQSPAKRPSLRTLAHSIEEFCRARMCLASGSHTQPRWDVSLVLQVPAAQPVQRYADSFARRHDARHGIALHGRRHAALQNILQPTYDLQRLRLHCHDAPGAPPPQAEVCSPETPCG